MVLTQFEYELQAANARAKIRKIEEKIKRVIESLALEPDCAMLRKDFRDLTLDMTITINELEHAESALEHFYVNLPSHRDSAEFSSL